MNIIIKICWRGRKGLLPSMEWLEFGVGRRAPKRGTNWASILLGEWRKADTSGSPSQLLESEWAEAQ